MGYLVFGDGVQMSVHADAVTPQGGGIGQGVHPHRAALGVKHEGVYVLRGGKGGGRERASTRGRPGLSGRPAARRPRQLKTAAAA